MKQTGAKDLFAALQEEVPQDCQPALLPPQSLHAAALCGGPAEMLWGASWGVFPEHPVDAIVEWQKTPFCLPDHLAQPMASWFC